MRRADLSTLCTFGAIVAVLNKDSENLQHSECVYASGVALHAIKGRNVRCVHTRRALQAFPQSSRCASSSSMSGGPSYARAM